MSAKTNTTMREIEAALTTAERLLADAHDARRENAERYAQEDRDDDLERADDERDRWQYAGRADRIRRRTVLGGKRRCGIAGQWFSLDVIARVEL